MMKGKNVYGSVGLLVLCSMLLFASCERMKVGYLRIDTATYAPDTVYVARHLDPTSDRALNNSPWVSSQIQGVAGTAPINYEFVSVRVEQGGDQAKFLEQVKLGKIFLQGSMILLTQEAVKLLPNGCYTLTLRIYNEGHEAVAKDIISFTVGDELPAHLQSVTSYEELGDETSESGDGEEDTED